MVDSQVQSNGAEFGLIYPWQSSLRVHHIGKRIFSCDGEKCSELLTMTFIIGVLKRSGLCKVKGVTVFIAGILITLKLMMQQIAK
ncbi:hypothetical protein [Pseudoalteromonas ostreae]|uniref:hypothetical protein n=1 Tax=Pseudoalteromonas ostreae TaxID=2774154 RepID=UPI001B38927E|nr:hypothetical protein [Pseudoalteromonas ostreae]